MVHVVLRMVGIGWELRIHAFEKSGINEGADQISVVKPGVYHYRINQPSNFDSGLL